MADGHADGRVRGEDRLRDAFCVERLVIRITPSTPSDDDRVYVLRPVEVVNPVRDRHRGLRPLDGGVFHQDVDGGVLLVNHALDVVADVSPERSDDTDPLRERRWALFLLVVEPAALVSHQMTADTDRPFAIR
jgi:hypothetical protein